MIRVSVGKYNLFCDSLVTGQFETAFLFVRLQERGVVFFLFPLTFYLHRFPGKGTKLVDLINYGFNSLEELILGPILYRLG